MPIDLAGTRLLVVDDEPVLNLTFAVLLRRAGAHVQQAANGAEALQLLQTGAVDLMVCDKQMPVMDGMTLLRRLHDESLSVPTLLFTNGIDREDMSKLEALGVRRLIAKPIQPLHLLQAVAEIVAAPAQIAA